MLKVENISKSFNGLNVISNLSFSVREGEIFALLGSNGAGKTTTFRIILSLLEADGGSISLSNKKIDYKMMEKIGYVNEEISLVSKMTVREQIIYYGRLKGMKKEDILSRLIYFLSEFQISDYLDKKIEELSKENQQKIQFISAIINEPILLILDEPFTGLDSISVKKMKEILFKLRDDGCMIIFSSHQMEYIEEFASKMVLLVNGRTILNGYIKDIKKEYKKMIIFIKGDIQTDVIRNTPGVIDVFIVGDEVMVKVEDDSVIDKVFSVVKDSKITKFVVEESSLNEIFIDIIGEIL